MEATSIMKRLLSFVWCVFILTCASCVAPVDPDALGWSRESWERVDSVIDALLAHAPNPFPQEEHRLEEGAPDTPWTRSVRTGWCCWWRFSPRCRRPSPG